MKRGFTLIEVVITIVILATVSIAITIPLLQTAKSTGANGAIKRLQLSALLQEESEKVYASLAEVKADEWQAKLSDLKSNSPFTTTPEIDGTLFQSSTTYECVKESLLSEDSHCSEGYSKISITVSLEDSPLTQSARFIKTANGIRP